MRISFLVVFMIFSHFVNSQSTEEIISYFKKKQTNAILENCVFPFDLRAGSAEDDSKVLTKEALAKKLNKLFKSEYFSDMLKKGVLKKAPQKISFTTKTFDKNGELESESALNFYFKKNVKGKLVLYSIILAG